ncbi:glycoside hydrolase family 76 protein [Aequorivita antarctica]|uniref:Glycosyl hydrolase n=1 Tax=Aequorivita antarctica TaxID=153266 RepID=A0A5C6YYH8_9FLAO|nr:glycoside hydrolase family 76 protein [Aequorivita antarctica]TXD72784.1 hypothetical protein ESU54_11225 [Aequorivita antarctica]SRX76216.1 hypothetical protein AEQU3_03215 [Aequorivita antarctica]
MATTIDFQKEAKEALTVLTTKWYNANPPSEYGSAYWIMGSYLWQSANALETILDYQKVTGDTLTFSNTVDGVYNAFDQAFWPGWFGYYDDESWWGISCLKAYQISNNKKWLSLAQKIYVDLQGGWDTKCGGGIWFKRNPKSYPDNFKGDIANELMMVLAGRLYNDSSIENNKEYLQWAEKTWTWMNKLGLIGSQFVIDQLGPDCLPIPEKPWTYTQGVLLGGAIELFKATGDRSYLEQAIKVADAVCEQLIWPSGILREKCELSNPESCDNNAKLFKGIFMRYLQFLYLELITLGTNYKDTTERYKIFIIKNATSLLTNYKNATFGLDWNGGSTVFGPVVQISGINVVIAAIAVTTISPSKFQ